MRLIKRQLHLQKGDIVKAKIIFITQAMKTVCDYAVCGFIIFSILINLGRTTCRVLARKCQRKRLLWISRHK
jgi:hypothetical protein